MQEAGLHIHNKKGSQKTSFTLLYSGLNNFKAMFLKISKDLDTYDFPFCSIRSRTEQSPQMVSQNDANLPPLKEIATTQPTTQNILRQFCWGGITIG